MTKSIAQTMGIFVGVAKSFQAPHAWGPSKASYVVPFGIVSYDPLPGI